MRSGPPKRSPGPDGINWLGDVSLVTRPSDADGCCPCALPCVRSRTIGMRRRHRHPSTLQGTLHDAEDQPPPPSEFTPRFTRRRAPPSHGVPDWPWLTRTARRRVIGARPATEIEWEWEARWARTLAGSMWLLLSPSVLGRCVFFLSSFYCCVFSPQGVGGSRGLECRSSNFLAQ